eukprot:645731-Rhodomonas_salina.1
MLLPLSQHCVTIAFGIDASRGCGGTAFNVKGTLQLDRTQASSRVPRHVSITLTSIPSSHHHFAARRGSQPLHLRTLCQRFRTHVYAVAWLCSRLVLALLRWREARSWQESGLQGGHSLGETVTTRMRRWSCEGSLT